MIAVAVGRPLAATIETTEVTEAIGHTRAAARRLREAETTEGKVCYERK